MGVGRAWGDYVIGKRPRVKARLTAAKADVDKLLADALALPNRMQRSLATLVRAQVHKSQQQPFAAASAFLGYFIDTDRHKRLAKIR